MSEYLVEYLIAQAPQLLRIVPDLILTGWIAVAVWCRFNKMDHNTRNSVAAQYGALFVGSICAFFFQFIPDLRAYSLTCALAGVVLFLLMSAHRWRGDSAPPGTEKLREVPSHQLKHVVGGKSETKRTF